MGRGHIELLHARDLEDAEFAAVCWPFGTRARMLSRDEDPAGGLTAVLRLPAGFYRVAGSLGCDSQFVILAGSLWIDKTPRVSGYYEFDPAGSGQAVWSTNEPCELLIKIEGAPDFIPGAAPVSDERISLDTSRMPWQMNPVPGAATGLTHKSLRFVEETGEMTALVANPPRFDYPALEFHDCVEEMYMIEGDIRLANSGRMDTGTYFWRPGYITHGPFYSHGGALMFLWTSSTLVNHVPPTPATTPAENLEQARREGTAKS